MRAGRSSLAGMWGGYPGLFPIQRIVQGKGRSGKRHCGGGEDQSQQESLVAVLVEQGRRNFLEGKKDVQIERKRDAGFLQS